MTVTGKVVLGLLTLAGATYIASEVLAARPRISGRIPGEPPPSPAPPPNGPPTGNYVGSGWTGWPHKDVFPDLDALVQALRRLGYNVTENLLSAQSVSEVGRFQADYNWWWQNYGDTNLGPVIQEFPAKPTLNLDQDGLLGNDTVEGMYDALLADQNFPGGWPALVAWYEARA